MCCGRRVAGRTVVAGHSAARIAAARLRRCQLKVKCVLVTFSGTQGTRAAGARRGRTEVQLVPAPNTKRLSALRSAAPWPPQPHPPRRGTQAPRTAAALAASRGTVNARTSLANQDRGARHERCAEDVRARLRVLCVIVPTPPVSRAQTHHDTHTRERAHTRVHARTHTTADPAVSHCACADAAQYYHKHEESLLDLPLTLHTAHWPSLTRHAALLQLARRARLAHLSQES
jgi:hypothetical protein